MQITFDLILFLIDINLILCNVYEPQLIGLISSKPELRSILARDYHCARHLIGSIIAANMSILKSLILHSKYQVSSVVVQMIFWMRRRGNASD